MGKICIYCQIKNEHLYLKEWLDYHFNLGFDKIYLMEDFDSLSHSAITNDYGDKVEVHNLSEIITIEDTKCVLGQSLGFEWFINSHFGDKSDIDWCAFIDIDEFIEFEPNYTLQGLVNEFSGFTGFYMYWKCYGANGHIKRESGTLAELYKSDESLIHYHLAQTKYFLNMKYPKKYHIISVHDYPFAVNGNLEYKDDYKREFPIYDKVWINHYICKSWEDWKLRLLRGENVKGNRNVDTFFYWNQDLLPYENELKKEVDISKCPTLERENFIYVPSSATTYDFDIKIWGHLDEKPFKLNDNASLNIPRKEGQYTDNMLWECSLDAFSNFDKNGTTHRCILYDNIILPTCFKGIITELINTYPKCIIFLGSGEKNTINNNCIKKTRNFKSVENNIGYIIPGCFKDYMIELFNLCINHNDEFQKSSYITEAYCPNNIFQIISFYIAYYKLYLSPVPVILKDNAPYGINDFNLIKKYEKIFIQNGQEPKYNKVINLK